MVISIQDPRNSIGKVHEFFHSEAAFRVLAADCTKLTLRAELTKLSTNGREVFLKDAGHYIHHDQPDAVIHVIRQVISEVKQLS
jgi:pimeloyl-ACP methyl ester carboxylesterase